MRAFVVLAVLLAASLAGCANTPDPSATDSDGDGFLDADEITAGTDPKDPTSVPRPTDANGDGIVVVAVIDGGFNPYHFDMVGSMMPQHLNADPSDDLPLELAPHLWIPGFPADPEAAFASYNRIDLNLSYAAVPGDIDEGLNSNDLYNADKAAWDGVKGGSSATSANYNYFPGTKVIGMVNTGGGNAFAATSHGVGTSTVSVGNIHGSCPECLLVFVNNGGGATVAAKEAANDWVMAQDWIDVQTNSYGYSTAMRDRMYAGSDVDAQKKAVTNGQAIFFSAGNGQGNTFTVPNPTLFSSQEGPDWIVTVGAIDPVGRNSYQGHGKPADIASIGSGYPSGGYCDNTINCTGGFGGTSNATPVVAGMYAKALYELRMMATRERDPSTEFIVNGVPGATVSSMAVSMGADGEPAIEESTSTPMMLDLTAPMLLDAMFLAAEHMSTGWVAGISGISVPVQTAEMQFMSEGHGSFVGRMDGNDVWMTEVGAIVDAALTGTGDMIDGEADWFAHDSFCRQSIWGEWEHGAWDGSNAPTYNPNWPVRTALALACPTVVATVVDVERIRDGF